MLQGKLLSGLIIITLSQFIFFKSPVFAQESGYGFKVGVQQSNISVHSTDGIKKGRPIVTPAFALGFYSVSTAHFGMYWEFNLLSSIGSDYTDTLTDVLTLNTESVTNELRIIFGSVGIMPTYQINNYLYLFAGPELDLMIARKFKGMFDRSSNGHTKAMGFIVDSSDKVVKVSLAMGAGVTYRIFRLDVRYNMGIGNLFETNMFDSGYGYDKFQKATYAYTQLSLMIFFLRQ